MLAAFFFCYSSAALAGGYSCVTLTLTLSLCSMLLFRALTVFQVASFCFTIGGGIEVQTTEEPDARVLIPDQGRACNTALYIPDKVVL
jgi:hypothetical protein